MRLLISSLDALTNAVGKLCAVLVLCMLFNVFYDVVARYLFNNVSIGMQELEWHFFALIFLMGSAYALPAKAHVRVDVIYEQLSPGKQRAIEVFGCLVFLMPFTLLTGYFGISFAYEAFTLNEGSGDPGGLPFRWIIKSAIPLGFFLMFLAGLAHLLRNLFPQFDPKNEVNP